MMHESKEWDLQKSNYNVLGGWIGDSMFYFCLWLQVFFTCIATRWSHWMR